MYRLVPVLLCAAWFACGDPAGAAGRPADPARAAASDTLRVHLGPPDAGADAFVALPAGQGHAPGLIVVHEWWGLNAQIREVARRLALQGYVAIVPDLYHGKVAGDAEQAHVLTRGLDRDEALGVLEGALGWLRAQPRTAKARAGVVGFCMGGALAERWALRGGDLAAVVMFYGSPETDPSKLAGLRAPLQGHFGADDDGIPAKKVEELRTGLAKAGKTGEIYGYPGAGHAFLHEGRDSYRPDQARQAWARMLAFLQKHLKG